MKYLIYVSDYSRFGCCPDNILPARGPKFQGCAEDLKNISSTPTPSEAPEPKEDCTTSKFGCCPDGSSASTTTLEYCAGIDLKNCSASAWGCCPDSNKTGKGHQDSVGTYMYLDILIGDDFLHSVFKRRGVYVYRSHGV